jgi:hypothetical protein
MGVPECQNAPWGLALDDSDKSKAYLVYAEWGPELRKPRIQRLRETFPLLPDAQLQEWLQEFERVTKAVWRFAEEETPKTPRDVSFRTDTVFSAIFTQQFPWMNDEALSRAWFLSYYYSWHEGYRT